MYKTAVILAAGDGKRMKSDLPKVMHPICGFPLVWHVERAVHAVSDDAPVVITGRKGELMHGIFGDRVRYAEQKERRGTAHAVMCARQYLEGKSGYVTVTAGDMPLLRAETFSRLLETAENENMAACVLTAVVADATGYGRILRDENGGVAGIVEHRDATEEQRKIREINTSVYVFRIEDLLASLEMVRDNNDQGELYLTDTLAILRGMGKKVGAFVVEDVTESMGINDRVQLAAAEKVMRRRINEAVMREGVTMPDPDNTYLDADVTVGRDTFIYPGNCLLAGTVIGENCVLYPGSRLSGSRLGSNVTVSCSVLVNADVPDHTVIAPFTVIEKE